MGYGEGDVAHITRATIHKGKLQTGTPENFYKWRLTFRGLCADQGWEREIADAPNVDDPDKVQDALLQVATGKLRLLGSDPDAFLFPRMLLVTGPLHIVWNSFESACKANPTWPAMKDFLSGVMSVLGHKGLKQRFLEVCMHGSTPEERRLCYGWKFHMVDWKWGYMEKMFELLAAFAPVFLARFDPIAMKKNVGHADATGSHVTMDMNAVESIKKAQAKRVLL